MADADRRVDPITGLPTEFDDEFDNQSVDSDELVSEPGHVGDLTDYNVQDVPSERAPDSQPATLIRCKVERMHIIAKQLGIANYKRLNKAPLYNAIYTAMTENTNCETCNGPCDPSSHVFPGIVDKSPVRTRGKSKSSLPPAVNGPPPPAGSSCTQPGLNSGSSVHDVLLGNTESNFVPDLESPPTPDVVLRDAIREGVAASGSSTTTDSSLLTEDDMAAAREAVKQRTAALTSTMNDNNLRCQNELHAEKDAVSSEDAAKKREDALQRFIEAEFRKTESRLLQEDEERERAHRQQIRQVRGTRPIPNSA